MTERGKVFTVECIGARKGDMVILALYYGDRLLEVQYALYDEETITFTTEKVYEDAKVMVWDGEGSLKPLHKAEKVYVY